MGLDDIDCDDDVPVKPPAPKVPTGVVLSQAVSKDGAICVGQVINRGGGDAATGRVDLDDLFGGIGASSGAQPQRSVPAHDTFGVVHTGTVPGPVGGFVVSSTSASTATPPPASYGGSGAKSFDVLDSLFSRESQPASAFHAGGGAAATGAPDDLFDTTKPAQRATYKDESTFLSGFEQHIKGQKQARNEPTLASLSSGVSNSRVAAHLLALMNYYDVLGVSQTASEEEIRRQYKKKALELHPDKVGRNQTAEEAELFKVITKAHEVLSDTAQREEYDRQLKQDAASNCQNWFAHLH